MPIVFSEIKAYSEFMKKQNKLRVTPVILIAIACWVGYATPRLHAQDSARQFKPDEMIETGGGMFAKILRCRGAGDDEECEVQYYRGDDPESTPRWENAVLLRLAEQRVLNSKHPNATQPDEIDVQPRTPPQAAEPTTAEEAGNCSFTPPAGDTGRTARPSEQLFKRKIYDNYAIGVNQSGQAPLRVGVTFLSFSVEAGFTNVVRVIRGVGAQRINDAAPANAIIYPVFSKHIVCEEYRDRTLRKQVENKYACFKNKDGDWVCGADGFPTIKQLN